MPTPVPIGRISVMPLLGKSAVLLLLAALSRIYNNQHWASDVFVGGALGYCTAKAAARAHAGKDGRWTFSAYPLERGGGAAASWRFD